MNPGLTPPLVVFPGVSLLHARAIGHNDTLHYLFCSGGAPALLLIHTHSAESVLQVNWTKFLSQDTAGSVKVEPESSVRYRGALVFTRVSLPVLLSSHGYSELCCPRIRNCKNISSTEVQEFSHDSQLQSVLQYVESQANEKGSRSL